MCYKIHIYDDIFIFGTVYINSLSTISSNHHHEMMMNALYAIALMFTWIQIELRTRRLQVIRICFFKRSEITFLEIS